MKGVFSVPDQEFLASFGVEIDEGGVNRLQAVLASNLEDASVSAQTVDTMYYCDIKKMNE